MKNLMTKKIVLYVGMAGTVLLLVLFSRAVSDWLYTYCFSTGRCPNFLDYIDLVGHFLLLTPPLFLLSLITYKMRDEVFRAWWNFARWWVPVIILVTYLQSTQERGGGMAATMSGGFDILLLGLFYFILIVVSLWRIVRTHDRLKRETK